MKTKISLLIGGVLLGFGLATARQKAPVAAASLAEACQQAPIPVVVEKAAVPQAVARASHAPSAVVAERPSEVTANSPQFEMPTDEEETLPAAVDKNSVVQSEIDFSEGLTDEMERQWASLPSQVRLVREERGWRVTDLKSGSLFSQTGLRNGDLINASTIDALNEGSSENLKSRVLQILESVTR